MTGEKTLPIEHSRKAIQPTQTDERWHNTVPNKLNHSASVMCVCDDGAVDISEPPMRYAATRAVRHSLWWYHAWWRASLG